MMTTVIKLSVSAHTLQHAGMLRGPFTHVLRHLVCLQNFLNKHPAIANFFPFIAVGLVVLASSQHSLSPPWMMLSGAQALSVASIVPLVIYLGYQVPFFS